MPYVHLHALYLNRAAMTDDFNEEKLCHFDPFSLRTANYFDNMIMNDALLYDLYMSYGMHSICSMKKNQILNGRFWS